MKISVLNQLPVLAILNRRNIVKKYSAKGLRTDSLEISTLTSLNFLFRVTKRQFLNDVNTFTPAFSILIKIVFVNLFEQCKQIIRCNLKETKI